jgi:Uma2 family endonuclease
MQLSDLDRSKTYSYADYYSWDFDERVELIDGKIFDLSSSPGTVHQLLSGHLSVELHNSIAGQRLKVFYAPFDVRLPKSSVRDEDIFTVVQPDICVCNSDKIDERGCIGAPVIMVEILIAGDNQKEVRDKFMAYQDAGVKEYWIIYSVSKTFLRFTLVEGRFLASRLLTFGDEVTIPILPDFVLSLDELFAEGAWLDKRV